MVAVDIARGSGTAVIGESRVGHPQQLNHRASTTPYRQIIRLEGGRGPQVRGALTWRHLVQLMKALAAAALVATASLTTAHALDISGAGATFPYPVYAKWADAYKKDTGIGLNYQSIGSGGGIKQILAKTVNFRASDMPLKAEELEERALGQFPMVMGGIVPVINVEGVKPGELVLDGPTLAKIFLGVVAKWDDEAIKKLNPKAKLPSDAIA